MKPPVLASPIPGESLILYISAQERYVGALLAQENSEGKENSLYSLSKMMTTNELNYPPIKTLCMTLVFSIQKLKHYFQDHVVHFVSRENPIKFKVMSKPVLSDRLSIKGQVLADFLADHHVPDDWELTNELTDEDTMVIEVQSPWRMYFDGATYRGGADAGIVFVISQGEVLPYSFTLTQLCSKNVAEYQALILGLEMTVQMKKLQLQVLGDSQKENKNTDTLATLASSLTLSDQAQVTACQKWVVLPPNEGESKENELDHLVAVSDDEKEE
ncbi:uncharacterized protein [Nicotiana tomentosiformis]|uniref:uncharacterized protein n=1 Tax=Nicotiana tomentosiformis TaxID=4098 RepID=UPI00388CB960